MLLIFSHSLQFLEIGDGAVQTNDSILQYTEAKVSALKVSTPVKYKLRGNRHAPNEVDSTEIQCHFVDKY